MAQHDEHESTTDAVGQAKARALSSPLRMRILRYCLHESRTNRQIAERVSLNPGTSLHHVRTLVDTGFLEAEEARTGQRGAREVPYRATGRSWDTPVPGISSVLIQTFLQEIEGLDPDEINVARLGLRLDEAGEREFHDRVGALLVEFKDRPRPADGRAISIMVATHPEQ